MVAARVARRSNRIGEWYNESSQLIPGQVAQLVERSPEKAGVGGSIPSLATIFNNLQTAIFNIGCNWLHFDFNCDQSLPRFDRLRRTPKAFEPPSVATQAQVVGKRPVSYSPGCDGGFPERP